MYCVNCGTNNQDGARVCVKCGEQLQTSEFANASGGAYENARAYGDAQETRRESGDSKRAYADFVANSGFLAPFINMWKNYTNFKDRTGVRDYWMSMLVYIIVCVAWGILMAIPAAIGLYPISGIMYILFVLFGLAAICPGLAITVRRLRDAGRPWPYIFISLIPFVGSIVLIVLLCGRSVPDDGTPVV
ncbi:MAG: DUF805 domain-containing protein [Clostridiales Family XIII bacterium]|jgi:uncharacterized membrane protein YhaH (DUF805 family)|nr:DUF805 domain-containing protein [Clostridiales Family XIII bacterium]